MEKQLDLSQASYYDLIVDKNRTLNTPITCTYVSGNTTMLFDFTPYTGATLQVKNTAGVVVLEFDTDDGSIELLTDGVFKLIKSAEDMNKPLPSVYNYDMYLRSATIPKRAFLKGKITFNQYTSD